MLDTPNDVTDVGVLADWIEACAAISTDQELSQPDVVGVLEPVYFEDEELSDALSTEELVADVWGRLHQRKASLPSYPYDVGGDRVEFLSAQPEAWAYVALMLCSYLPRIDSAHHVRTSNNRDFRYVFEKLVEGSATRLFGGATYRFGWPRDFEADWPTHINDRVTMLADLLDLKILKLPTQEEAQAKDRSLDVIARVRLLNENGGTGYVLIQCATGKNYQDKRSEPYKTDWHRLFDWDSELIRCVAIPMWVSSHKELYSHFRRFTEAVILDRSRLMHGHPATSMSEDARNVVQTWAEEQLASLPEA